MESSHIQIHIPAVSDDRISRDLVDLTEALSKAGIDISSGFLGGEYGYGAAFENDVFMMHPFCWCEGPDCPWCLSCVCGEDATRYFLADGSEVRADTFFDAGGYRTGKSVRVLENECRNHREGTEPAPNFLHKPTGTQVRWYKYIGRGMEVGLKADWRGIFDECVASVSA